MRYTTPLLALSLGLFATLPGCGEEDAGPVIDFQDEFESSELGAGWSEYDSAGKVSIDNGALRVDPGGKVRLDVEPGTHRFVAFSVTAA